MNLFKSFSTYTVASFIEKGVAFFLLPVFTFYLSPKDYGVLSLLQSLFAFTLPLISLGSLGALSVAYYNRERSEYPSYFSSSLVFPILVTMVLMVFLILFKNALGIYFEIPPVWIVIIPLFCFLSTFNSMLLVDFQIKNEPLKYVKFSLSNSTLSVLLSLFFVINLNLNYSGRLYGQYLGLMLFAVVAFYILFKKRKVIVGDIKPKYIKDSIKFGLPLVPHTIGCMVINMSDRLFIDQLLGKEALGIYNTGYIVGSAISIFCSAFASAIIPFSYELFKLNTAKAKRKLVKVYWIFIGILASIVCLVWFFSPFVFEFFINEKFRDGQKYVMWITLGYTFQGLYLLFANIIFYFKKTRILFNWSFINVSLNILLNYILINKFGAIGAAYTLCISYFLFFISMALITNKFYPLPWLSIFTSKRYEGHI